MRDFAMHLMNGAVTLWLVVGAALIWGWPLIARVVPWRPRSEFLLLMLPRGVTIAFVILSSAAILFHVVVTGGQVSLGTVLCLGGFMASVMMRSTLRRQVSP